MHSFRLMEIKRLAAGIFHDSVREIYRPYRLGSYVLAVSIIFLNSWYRLRVVPSACHACTMLSEYSHLSFADAAPRLAVLRCVRCPSFSRISITASFREYFQWISLCAWNALSEQSLMSISIWSQLSRRKNIPARKPLPSGRRELNSIFIIRNSILIFRFVVTVLLKVLQS
jgi:hypothetical protein